MCSSLPVLSWSRLRVYCTDFTARRHLRGRLLSVFSPRLTLCNVHDIFSWGDSGVQLTADLQPPSLGVSSLQSEKCADKWIKARNDVKRGSLLMSTPFAHNLTEVAIINLHPRTNTHTHTHIYKRSDNRHCVELKVKEMTTPGMMTLLALAGM